MIKTFLADTNVYEAAASIRLKVPARMGKRHLPPVLKKAFLNVLGKPATEEYPFVKRELAEDFRGEPILDSKLCISCGLCYRDCPAKAIEMVEVDGKKRPQFHLDKCVFCYQCVDTCPKKAIKSSAIYELATTDKSELLVKPS